MGGIGHFLSSVTHAITDPITTAVKDLSSGHPGNIFKDEFSTLKKDAKDSLNATAEVVTKAGKAAIHLGAETFKVVNNINVKLTQEAGKLVGNNALGRKLNWAANHMQQDGNQLVGFSEGVADGQARLAEAGKFFDPKAQAAEAKNINNNWIKDRVVYDANGTPHVIQGLGSKAGMALSVASIFLPVLAPVAVAVNAAAAADNGNWKGVALAAVSAVAPEAAGAFQDAVGAAQGTIEGALAGAAAKGLVNGAANAALGGNFTSGFESGALSSLGGSAVNAVGQQVLDQVTSSSAFQQLPTSIQDAITNAATKAVSQGMNGQSFNLHQLIAQALAGAAGDAASSGLGLNADTAKVLSGAISLALKSGQPVDFTALAQKLPLGSVTPAFIQMLKGGTTAVSNGTPAQSDAAIQAMLNASYSSLPPSEVTAAPAAPSFTVQRAHALGNFRA